MDPITKALHETWKKIVSEANDEYVMISGKEEDDGWKPNPPKRAVTKGGKIITINDPGYRPRKGREHIRDGSGRQNTWQDSQGNIHVTYGIQDNPPKGMKRANYGGYVEIGDDYKEGDNLQDYYNKKSKERKDALNNYFNPRKPTPTPGDGSWGGSKPTPGTGAWGGGQPKKPKYGPDGNFIGFDDGTTPTPSPKPTPGYDLSPSIKREPRPYPNYGDGDGAILKRAEERAEELKRRANSTGAGPDRPAPIMPTRTPAPQPAVPATTGSGLLNSVLNTNKKMYNSVISSLPSMPKIYEERDAEGQMAIGELKVLAQKAQELANMMKDDTQLEAWVQSKITKAKDYISSVHDYMNGNPDKID